MLKFNYKDRVLDTDEERVGTIVGVSPYYPYDEELGSWLYDIEFENGEKISFHTCNVDENFKKLPPKPEEKR